MDAYQTFEQEQSKMMRPIAGQSMTNDPANPDVYEQAPRFTNFHEASEYMWDSLTEESEYAKYMTGISKGVPIMSIVQVILFNEFQQGTFNPDLMMMMIEPTAFMLIALAERLDLDIKITLDDDEDEEEELFGVKVEEDKLEKLRASVGGGVPSGALTPEMEEELNALPDISSLLSPEQPQEVAAEEVAAPATDQQPSLMAPPEGQA
jgi:hypothetical protein